MATARLAVAGGIYRLYKKESQLYEENEDNLFKGQHFGMKGAFYAVVSDQSKESNH